MRPVFECTDSGRMGSGRMGSGRTVFEHVMFERVKFERMAREALAHWDLDGIEPEFVRHRENAVFRVRPPEGDPLALRIHRPGYHDDVSLRSEAQWTGRLHDAGVSVPRPIPTRSGASFVHLRVPEDPRDFQVDMVTWLGGITLVEKLAAPATTAPEVGRVFSRLGASAGIVHRISDEAAFPAPFRRHAWDLDGLLGPAPFWDPFWNVPQLGPAQARLLSRGREAARLALEACIRDGADYGLIHADLGPDNVLVTDDAVHLIDFDDGGFGWRMFEMATVLFAHDDHPDVALMEEAFVAGYRTERELPDAELARFDLFTLLRAFTYIGWAQTRLFGEEAARRIPAMIDDACALTEAFLSRG